MKKYLHFLAYTSIVALIGCGNSELESKVYEKYGGKMRCQKCVEERAKIMADYKERRNKWLMKEWLEGRIKNDDVFISNGLRVSFSERAQARYDPEPTVIPHVGDIENVSSRKKMEDLYVVTIEAECPKHGKYEEKHEYSYRNGKCRHIREIKE